MTQTHQRLLEYTALSLPPGSSAHGRVDRERGIIHNVKILGITSANNRIYPTSTIVKAASLYEGAKVNVDHPAGHLDKSRSYSDRIGVLRNVRPESDGLRGDLHANPQHALWEQLAWDAENAPESAGFSHNIIGKTSKRGGRTVVEEITRVTSVDLVADPATTRGLFESIGSPAAKTAADFLAEAKQIDHEFTEILETETPRQFRERRAARDTVQVRGDKQGSAADFLAEAKRGSGSEQRTPYKTGTAADFLAEAKRPDDLMEVAK